MPDTTTCLCGHPELMGVHRDGGPCFVDAPAEDWLTWWANRPDPSDESHGA